MYVCILDIKKGNKKRFLKRTRKTRYNSKLKIAFKLIQKNNRAQRKKSDSLMFVFSFVTPLSENLH